MSVKFCWIGCTHDACCRLGLGNLIALKQSQSLRILTWCCSYARVLSNVFERVFSWGTWGCDVSKFPWTYDSNESCYLLQGQVTVTPDDGRNPATFGKGDFVTFPAGMSCTWDVSEAVQKHFLFF